MKKEIIKRIKSDEPHIVYFPNGDCYNHGMSDIETIAYHLSGLEDIAGQNVEHLELVSIGLQTLVDNLKAMNDSYGAVEDLLNPEA